MAEHKDLAEWHGKDLVDRDGHKVGRHLTFVPLREITIGPDSLQVPVSRDHVQDAPNIDMHGDELSHDDESALYHHYQLNYMPPNTESGRRLARR